MSSSEGGGDGEGGGQRPIRDMQALLKFCVSERGSASEDGTVRSMDMTPERRAWLEEAIKSMSVDVVQEMLEAIESIKNELVSLNRDEGGEDEEGTTRVINSIDGLIDRIQDLDIAADFHKIGGFEILPPLLNSRYPNLIMKGAELVGELVQNLEYCQKAALEMGILDMLVNILDSSSLRDEVKVKGLYAVSCLIRNNPMAQEVFENKLEGYSVLLRLMQSTSSVEFGPKLRTKSAFLLGSIIQESVGTGVKERLFRMGYIEQLVGLLHLEHDLSHEHLLSALLAFVSDFKGGVKECRRPELQLKELLENRIRLLHGQEKFLEEVGYSKQILNLCFREVGDNVESTESER